MPNTLCPILERLDSKWVERMVIFPVDERNTLLLVLLRSCGKYLEFRSSTSRPRRLQRGYLPEAAAREFRDTLPQGPAHR